jgi:hypothetical protein
MTTTTHATQVSDVNAGGADPHCRRGRRGRRGWSMLAPVVLGAVAALAIGVAPTSAAPATTTTPPATNVRPSVQGLRIVAGLRGFVADVYLDGNVLVRKLEPEHNTDLLPVTTGPHRLEVRKAGAAPASSPAVATTFDLTASTSMSAVLHLAADGTPTLSTFTDNMSNVAAGKTRVVVRNVAATKPIDVRVGTSSAAQGLANRAETSGEIASGRYAVNVIESGTGQMLSTTENVPLTEGADLSMYFVGDQYAKNLGWIAVQIDGLETAPGQIAAGDSGLVDPTYGTGTSSNWSAAGLVGAVAAFTIGALTVRKRSRRVHRHAQSA